MWDDGCCPRVMTFSLISWRGKADPKWMSKSERVDLIGAQEEGGSLLGTRKVLSQVFNHLLPSISSYLSYPILQRQHNKHYFT
jgi:hypothetical protein